jgi:zinc protease
MSGMGARLVLLLSGLCGLLTTEAAMAQAQATQSGATAKVAELDLGFGLVQHWRLANGLDVVLAPDPAVPVVAVHTWVRVGSAHEQPGKTGLAHLLEHLMFKATRTRPAGTFDRVLEQMGASANAATWLDWTFYHETVPPDVLPQVFEMEADRLTQLDLTPLAFRSELDVVKNERRDRVDADPDGQLDEVLSQAAYGNHPYAHPILGTDDDLGRLGLPDVLQFYRAHYAPDRIALVVVGGFEPARTLGMIERHYAAIPTSGARPPQPAVALPTAATEVALPIEAGAERLLVAWRGPAGDHPDHPVLALAVEALFGSDGARLTRQLVHEAHVADDVSAHLVDARGPALVDVRASLLPGRKARQVLPELEKGLAALAQRPLTDAELKAARNRMKTGHYRELAGVDGRAESIGVALASFGDLQHSPRWWQAVDQASAADVQRVLKAWLTSDRRVVVFGELRERVSRGRGRGKDKG